MRVNVSSVQREWLINYPVYINKKGCLILRQPSDLLNSDTLVSLQIEIKFYLKA